MSTVAQNTILANCVNTVHTKHLTPAMLNTPAVSDTCLVNTCVSGCSQLNIAILILNTLRDTARIEIGRTKKINYIKVFTSYSVIF